MMKKVIKKVWRHRKEIFIITKEVCYEAWRYSLDDPLVIFALLGVAFGLMALSG